MLLLCVTSVWHTPSFGQFVWLIKQLRTVVTMHLVADQGASLGDGTAQPSLLNLYLTTAKHVLTPTNIGQVNQSFLCT